jgi:hypothetical protein
MKKYVALVLSLAAGTAFAGEKAQTPAQAPAKAACECKTVTTKKVVMRPVELKVVEVKTVKGYVAEEVCEDACGREGLLARSRARRAERRADRHPATVVCVSCPEAAAATKK